MTTAPLAESRWRSATTATLALIAIALLLRLSRTWWVGLGSDEVYTVAISRELSWSYFDHPPLHQWITHLAARWLGEGPSARLPFVLLFSLTSWLLFLVTRRLHGGWAGFWAVVLLNLSAFFTLSAGGWIVPDGPLLACLALMAWALTRLFVPAAHEAPTRATTRWALWLLAGLALGLAGLAKYHAALIGLGLAGFLLGTRAGRAELRHPAPWVAGLLAVAIVVPVLAWNAEHGWASFLFQAGRSQGAGFTPWLIGVSVLAQAGWLLPWVMAPILLAVRDGWRTHRDTDRDTALMLLLSLAVPIIALFTLMPAFGNLGLPHWAAPGWFLLLPVAGGWLAALPDRAGLRRRTMHAALWPLAIVTLLASHAATGWGARLVPALSRTDPTLELFAWDEVPARLAAMGLAPARDGRFVMGDNWQNSGRLAVAFGPEVTVAPASRDPRHFAFLIDQRTLIGRDAVLVIRGRRVAQARAALAGHFDALGSDRAFSIGRGGLAEIDLVAIEATGFRTPLPWGYGITP